MEEVFYPKFPSEKSFYALTDCGPTFMLYTFLLKHIAEPKWLAMFATAIKCKLQGPAMSRKHLPMNLGHFISKIIQKASQPFTQLKQISITSLIETLGFKASFIDKKLVT